MEPLNGGLCYPTISVRGRFRRAGIYKRVSELRDKYSTPVLTRIRWLYVAHSMPVFVYELCAVWPCGNCGLLSAGNMRTAENVAQAMVSTFGAPV